MARSIFSIGVTSMTHMYPLCFWLLALVVGVTAIGRFLGTLAVEEMLKRVWKGSWSPVPWQVRQAASSFCLLECWLGHSGLTHLGMQLCLEFKHHGSPFPKFNRHMKLTCSLPPWKNGKYLVTGQVWGWVVYLVSVVCWTLGNWDIVTGHGVSLGLSKLNIRHWGSF